MKSRLLLLCTRHGLGSREQALARIDDDSVFQCRGPLQLGCEADATFLIFRSKLYRAHKVVYQSEFGSNTFQVAGALLSDQG